MSVVCETCQGDWLDTGICPECGKPRASSEATMAEQSVSVSPVRAAELADDPRQIAVFTKDMAFWQWRDEVCAYLRSIAAALSEGEAVDMVSNLRRLVGIFACQKGGSQTVVILNSAADLLEAQPLALAQQKAEYANLEITAASCAVKLLAMEAEVARLTAIQVGIATTSQWQALERAAVAEARVATARQVSATQYAQGYSDAMEVAEASESRLRKALEQIRDGKYTGEFHPMRIADEALTPTASGAAPADGEEENDNG